MQMFALQWELPKNVRRKAKERLFHTYKFSNQDNNKFILLSWKGVYPYEYMGDWEKFNEKEDFYSYLNMEDITYADYVYANRACKDFEIKNSGEYHDLFVQSDTLLLADVFENFWNKLKYMSLIPQNFFQLLD